MGTDNLLHYGRVHLIQNGDPSTRRPSSLHGSLKQNGESLTIFSEPIGHFPFTGTRMQI